MSPVLAVAVFSWGIRCQFDDSVYTSTEQVSRHLSFVGLRHPLILPEMTQILEFPLSPLGTIS